MREHAVGPFLDLVRPAVAELPRLAEIFRPAGMSASSVSDYVRAGLHRPGDKQAGSPQATKRLVDVLRRRSGARSLRDSLSVSDGCGGYRRPPKASRPVQEDPSLPAAPFALRSLLILHFRRFCRRSLESEPGRSHFNRRDPCSSVLSGFAVSRRSFRNVSCAALQVPVPSRPCAWTPDSQWECVAVGWARGTRSSAGDRAFVSPLAVHEWNIMEAARHRPPKQNL